MENKTGKYFKYAIGEIVLVVIGILVAIWINGIYNDFKERKVEKNILENLVIDIEADLKQIEKIESNYERQLNGLKAVKTAFFKNQDNTITEYIKQGYGGAGLTDINPRTSTYDEMINSGKLYNLSNKHLTDLCIDYYEMLEKNTYEIRQSRVEYRNIHFSSEMNEYWLLYLDIRESDKNIDYLIKSFVSNKNSIAYKTLKQSTGYGEMLIQSAYDDLKEIKASNRNIINELNTELDKIK